MRIGTISYWVRRARRWWCGALLAPLALAALSAGAAASDFRTPISMLHWLSGVNVAGGEFGPAGDTYGVHYTYPDTSVIDYYALKRFRLIRLPTLAKRLVRTSAEGGSETTGDMDIVLTLIDHAAKRGMYVVLDLHDYGRARTGELIGRDHGAAEVFAADWKAIAARIGARPNVLFGLMNEPHEQSAWEWLVGANAAIAAIRQTGATQGILVGGSYWSGAESWTKSQNAPAMLGVVDPLNNYAYEVHSYFDWDYSGTTPDAVPTTGVASLQAVTDWARANRKRVFLGEFGWAANPQGNKEGEALLRFLSENRDVWLGWAYWAGGPWWGDYMFSVEPDYDNLYDRPQMRILTKYAR